MIKLQKNNGSIDFNTITMLRGEDGGYYIPAVDENGNLSWIATGENMPEVAITNIRGPQGKPGIQGPIGLTGATGKQGERGKSGVYVGAIEPTDDSLIWINPEGQQSEIIGGGGGVSSWNDLTDKPFYEEIKITNIINEYTATNLEQGSILIDGDFNLVGNETYIINWNGTEYYCKALDMSEIVPGAVFLGNLAGLLMDDTGEPFCLAYIPGDGIEIRVVEPMEEITFSIYQRSVIYHTLNPRFIKDMYFQEQVVETLTTSLDLIDMNNVIESSHQQYFRIFEETPTPETLYNAEITQFGSTKLMSELGEMIKISDVAYQFAGGMYALILEDNVAIGDEIFPKAGVYVGSTIGVSFSIKIPNYQRTIIQQIDPKYIPMDAIIAALPIYNGEVL